MTIPVRTQVEDQIVALLCPLRVESEGGKRGGYLRTIAAYEGDTSPGENDDNLIRALKGGRPAVLVATAEGAYNDESATLNRRNTENSFFVDLLICSQNTRALAKTRGDGFAADPGIYQVIEDVRSILLGEDFDIDCVGGLEPQSEGPVLQANAMHIWLFRWSIIENVNLPDFDDDMPDLAGIDVDVNERDDDDVSPVVESAIELAT